MQRTGTLSGETFTVPDVTSGYPVSQLIDTEGNKVEEFDRGVGFDDYKEKVIRERLTGEGIDAIVVCGTNLASLALAEKLEPVLDIPIVGINATLLWYALRENGITAPLLGASRLLRDL